MKKSICLFGTLLFCWMIIRLFYFMTDGFMPTHITPHFSANSAWNVKEPENKSAIDKILSQPFFYLDKGHQSYVFESEDGEWVIKFPKFQRYRLPVWSASLPLPKFLDDTRREYAAFKGSKMKWNFDSWKIAYEDLSRQTGVVWVHINPETDVLPRPLILVDKVGWRHSIDLSRSSFLVQHKGEVLERFIKKSSKHGSLDEVKAMFHKLIALYVQTFRAGFYEEDPHTLRNTGIVNGEPIYLDPARFIQDPRIMNPQLWKPELLKKTANLRKWIDKHYPSLSGVIEQEIGSYVS